MGTETAGAAWLHEAVLVVVPRSGGSSARPAVAPYRLNRVCLTIRGLLKRPPTEGSGPTTPADLREASAVDFGGFAGVVGEGRGETWKG